MATGYPQGPTDRPLLIVEDSDEDYEATVWALRRAGLGIPVERCERAQDVLRRLVPEPGGGEAAGSRPCLILLDLNLPGMDGRQLLSRLRTMQEPPDIPVVVLSTSSNPRDVAACYRLGAAGYLNKPLSLEQFAERMRGLVAYWFETVQLPESSL